MAEKPNFSSNWCEDKLYSCVVGFIYIFCFLNVQEGRTRWRMFFFYALQMFENTLIIITWMLVDNSLEYIYQWMFTAIVYIGFLGGESEYFSQHSFKNLRTGKIIAALQLKKMFFLNAAQNNTIRMVSKQK